MELACIHIDLVYASDRIQLSITDNGRGRSRQRGYQKLRQFWTAWNAGKGPENQDSLSIEGHNGKGTRVVLTMPVENLVDEKPETGSVSGKHAK